MKKLMIAAAIVCAAVASQAATYDWNFKTSDPIYTGYTATEGGFVGTDAIAPAGFKAYLIAFSAGFDQDDLLKAIRDDGMDIKTAAGANLIKTSETDANGLVKSVKWDQTADSMPTIDAFLVVANADNSSVFLTNDYSFDGMEHPMEAPIEFNTIYSRMNKDAAGTASFAGEGWYAVPEPTSGLLLLLGVAGLALRRRRA